jgi:hypothetical protein
VPLVVPPELDDAPVRLLGWSEGLGGGAGGDGGGDGDGGGGGKESVVEVGIVGWIVTQLQECYIVI